MRILIVEDSKEIQKYYARGLERKGVSFDLVESRGEAVERLKCRSYEGAIVDLQLTDDESYSQGIEVLKYMRRVDEGTNALVVSGTPHPQDIIDSYEGGALRVIAKADKGFAEIAEEFVDQCSLVKLRKFGEFRSLNAYLANPSTIPIWEDLVQRTLQCGYPKMQKSLAKALDKYAPILRPLDAKSSVSMDPDCKLVSGTFWSKAAGFSIFVAISGLAEIPPNKTPSGGIELDSFAPVNSVRVKTWKLPYLDRTHFPEFLDDLAGAR